MENVKLELKKEIMNDFEVKITDEDFEVLENKHNMSINDIKDSLDKGDIHFEKNMVEMLLWQNDTDETAEKVLRNVLNLEINEDFLRKYKEAKCKNLAEYVNTYLTDDMGEKVTLSNCVAYIYG